MQGAIAAKATRPVTSGEFSRWRTSNGKATVDILLPNIDIDDPTIRVRNGELDSTVLADRHLHVSFVENGFCRIGRVSASAGELST